jgi:hypothetical protein
MGIVDFLQDWNMRKRLERASKIYLQRNDPMGVSVMRPLPYRDRFQKKMEQIFDIEDPLAGRGSARLSGGYSSSSVSGVMPSGSRAISGKTRLPPSVYKEVESGGTVMNFLHLGQSHQEESQQQAAQKKDESGVELARMSTMDLGN